MISLKDLAKRSTRSRISNTIIAWMVAMLFAIELLILGLNLHSYSRQLAITLAEHAEPRVTGFVRSIEKTPNIRASLPPPILELAVFDSGGSRVFSTDPSFSFSDFERYRERHGHWEDERVWFAKSFTTQNARLHAVGFLNEEYVATRLIAYTRESAGIFLLSLLLVMVGTWLGVRQVVVGPLRKIIGNLSKSGKAQKVDLNRSDELGELASAYNAMIDDIETANRRAKIKQNHLEYIAYHDALTNMMNRRAFLKRLGDALDASQAAVFIIGIDNLKMLNDQMGTDVGDSVLAEIGRRLALFDAEHCFSARLEGDEFGVACTRLAGGEAGLKEFAEKILRSIRVPHLVRSTEIVVSASLGLAAAQPDEGSLEAAYKNATIAMQNAKRSGGDRFCLFTANMRAELIERMRLIDELERGIQLEEFYPVYQPKVNLATRELDGMECLVRWRRESGEVISPGLFIPLAEETGKIVEISEQVFSKAFEEFRYIETETNARLKLALNLSAVQLSDIGLPVKIGNLLREYDVDPQSVELELTESSIMENIDKSIPIMHSINSIGIDLAVDDFGTGYSSLSYLKQFPVQTIKIDQSFVRELGVNYKDEAIVATIVSLCQKIGMRVVAEGIEEREQSELLTQAGCHIGQGYYFGKPMSKEDFIEWAKNWKSFSAAAVG